MPERALLSVHTAKVYPVFQKAVQEQGCQPPERVVLSALLLWLSATQVQADNSWAPYLRVLPKDYTILGAFCEDLEDEFQARFSRSPHTVHPCLSSTHLPGSHNLQASHAIQSCHRARLCLRQDHSTAQKLLESLELPAKFRSWSAWTFAAGAVATRTMHFPDSDAGCLVPFGDMHNYHPPPAPELPNFPAERLNHTAGEQTDAGTSPSDHRMTCIICEILTS